MRSKGFICRHTGCTAKAGMNSPSGAPVMDFVFTICDQAAGELGHPDFW